MVAGFARATRLIASLTQALEHECNQVEINRIRAVRNDVSGLFTSVNAESDAVPFESGSDRRSHLAARERIRRWLSTLRTVYVLELPLLQLKQDRTPSLVPTRLEEVDPRFYEALSSSLNHIADCLERHLNGTSYEHLHQNGLLDVVAEREPYEFSLASMRVDGTKPSLRLLAELVDELKSDVLKAPVFAS
jgi:multidrug resistance protein MdtO